MYNVTLLFKKISEFKIYCHFNNTGLGESEIGLGCELATF